MLTDLQRDRISVILVSPRNPLNTGAVARAMANFGFGRLAVVAPYEPHWREARSAVGAPELLQNAIEAPSLEEAVKDCTLVIGTGSLTYRKPEQRVISLPAISSVVQQEFARAGRIALVFGPEKHGLTREDLSYCNLLVEIPTDPRQPSMNLGQAAAVCLYELSIRSLGEDNPTDIAQPEPTATSGDLDILAALIEEAMHAANYPAATMQAANRHGIRLLLRRLHINSPDSKRVLGLFRRILWRLKRTSGRNVTN